MSWWSLSFMGITMTGRYPLKILIWGSGWLPLCVKVQGVLPQSRVTQTSEIWFLFEMLFLSWNVLPTLWWLGCCLKSLGMSTVLWWYRPRSIPDIYVLLSATGSLLRYWPHYSMFWMLGIPYPLGGSTAAVCEFVSFSVESNVSLSKDACSFCFPFRVCWLLAWLHVRKKDAWD